MGTARRAADRVLFWAAGLPRATANSWNVITPGPNNSAAHLHHGPVGGRARRREQGSTADRNDNACFIHLHRPPTTPHFRSPCSEPGVRLASTTDGNSRCNQLVSSSARSSQASRAVPARLLPGRGWAPGEINRPPPLPGEGLSSIPILRGRFFSRLVGRTRSKRPISQASWRAGEGAAQGFRISLMAAASLRRGTGALIPADRAAIATPAAAGDNPAGSGTPVVGVTAHAAARLPYAVAGSIDVRRPAPDLVLPMLTFHRGARRAARNLGGSPPTAVQHRPELSFPACRGLRRQQSWFYSGSGHRRTQSTSRRCPAGKVLTARGWAAPPVDASNPPVAGVDGC